VKLIKVNKHLIRSDKIVAIEEGKFLTNMLGGVGGYFCAIIYLEGGHTISTTADHKEILSLWKDALEISG